MPIPSSSGLVASLNRPGGNVTGVSEFVAELTGKRLELLHEIAPAARIIGFLSNPDYPAAEVLIRQHETAAQKLGVRLVSANARTPSEIEPAFATLVQRGIGAFLSANDALFWVEYHQLIALAARYALPGIYPIRAAVDAGGLMSYGPSETDAFGSPAPTSAES